MYTKFELKTERVKSLSFHPKCYWLLVAFHNGAIMLYDYVDKNLLEEFEGHEGPVRALSFHKTLSLFVSGGDDYLVKVWDWRQRRCLFDLKGHTDYVRTTFFHDENPWIASASDDQTIRIWNWQSRSCIAVLTGHYHYVMCAQFHPKEDLIVSASLDQTARVWNISGLKNSNASGYSPTGKSREGRASQGILDSIINLDLGVKFILEGHENGVNWAEFHPTQPLIVTASDDKTVRLWRVSGSQAWETDVYRGHMGNVSCVTFHPTQDLILSNSEDKTLKIWNLRKRIAQTTIKRENSRFWSIVRHPKFNIFAAGHDGGFLVFKLERERPAVYNLEKAFIYVDNRNIRIYDYATKESRVLYILPSNIKSTLGNPCKLSYNPSERAFLLSSSDTKCAYQMFSFKNHDFDADGIPNAGEVYHGTGSSAMFVSKNKIAVLDKGANQQVLIRDLKNAAIGRIGLPTPNSRAIHCISPKSMLVVSESSLYVCDLETLTVSAVLNLDDVTQVYVSPEKSLIALISKKNTKVKSGAWYDNNIFVYNNAYNIKYLLMNGDSGVLLSVMAPMYLIRIIGNTLTYLTSKLEVGRVELDFAECVFKYNAIIGNNTVVQQMITSTNLVGQSIIGYLRERGYSDIPLDFIKDPKSKFDMAMSCKNFQVAFDIAKNLEDIEIWDILGQEAFKYGEIEISETAFQKSKNLHALNNLYLVTGNAENLLKMVPIYLSLGDYSSAYINALLVGDANSQIDVLLKTKRPLLAYLLAKSSGNQELAATILNDSSLGAYPDSVDSYIPKDKISLGIGFKLENAEKHEDKVPIVNENSSREDPLPEKRDQHFDKLSPGNSEDANSHWDIDSNDSEEQSDQVQISPGGASPDFQQHEGGQQGITREVTFNEVIDYAYKVMKLRRGIVVFDKFQGYLDDMSAVFEPVKLSAGDENGLPSRILFHFLFQRADSVLKTAQSDFVRGRLIESLGGFRESLRIVALASVNCEDDTSVMDRINVAASYVLGLCMESLRRSTIAQLTPRRNMELASYFTFCVKIPEHHLLVLRSALHVAKTSGFVDCVKTLSKKILDMNPGPDVVQKINKGLSSLDISKQDPDYVDFDYDSSKPICCKTFSLISEQSKTSQCLYCKSLFKKEYAPEVCNICELALVE